MTRAFKCDWCGELTTTAWIQLDVDHWASGTRVAQQYRLDYCDECAPQVAKLLVDGHDETTIIDVLKAKIEKTFRVKK